MAFCAARLQRQQLSPCVGGVSEQGQHGLQQLKIKIDVNRDCYFLLKIITIKKGMAKNKHKN